MSLMPITNLPYKYADGMTMSYASATTITVLTGQVRDSTNIADIAMTTSVTLNSAVNGINGLDTGTVAVSSIYYVFAVGSSINAGVPGVTMSLSSTAPYLPRNYDLFRLIGFAFTDSSANFLPFSVVGRGTERTYVWESSISVLSGGTASTYTAVDCSGAVPPITNTYAICDVSFTPATAADSVGFRPTGSTATQIPTLSSVVASKAQKAQMKLLTRVASSKAKFDYQNSAGSGSTTVFVSAFEFYI